MRKRSWVASLAAWLLFSGIAAAQTPPASGAAAAPPSASAAPPPGGETGKHVVVEGFRSAHWGMTDAQVKAAIQGDFKVPAAKIRAEENAAEKTTVLSVEASDVLEGAGLARVSYIFGYTTKKLIQVNLLWGTSIDPRVKPEEIVTAANQLRQLFVDSGYQPGAISNTRSADGTIIVFEGQDAQKHTTLLRLATTPAPAEPDKDNKDHASATLFLIYILDARNPDIFRLKEGQF